MVSQTHRPEVDAAIIRPRIRPMDPARDLAAIARVIEVSFAEELSPGGHVIMRDLRLLNTFRPVIWFLTRALPALGDFMSGYVWEENGRVVGNVTVTRSHRDGREWIISNVAVLPAYRRQGIGYKLMKVAIEHAALRGAGCISLQVRSDNEAAKELYYHLGFRYIEAVTEMVSEYVRPSHFPVPANVRVRRPVDRYWREAYEVAQATVPPAAQALRPLDVREFRPSDRSILEAFRDHLLGPARERWWVELDGRITGLLAIDRRMNRAHEQLEMLVHPRGRGQVEKAMVNQLTSRLRGRRGVRGMIPADLFDAQLALHEAGFRKVRTLDQMVLDLTPATGR